MNDGTALGSRLHRIAGQLLELGRVRLDLAVTEAELLVVGLLTDLLLGLAAVLLGVLALAGLGACAILAAGEAHRLLAAALVTAAYLLLTLLCVAGLRVRRRRRGRWFDASRAELAADAEVLRRGAP